MSKATAQYHLESKFQDQNFWHLSCIMGASLGLPGSIIGSQIAKAQGLGVAISSILIGNLILWILGLAMIAMAIENRRNAIQNVEGFLGKYGAILASFILMLSFMDWYVIQLNSTSEAFNEILPKENYLNVRLGAALGLFVALFSLGGIKIIKFSCYFLFLPILGFFLYAALISDYSRTYNLTWAISLSGIISIIQQNLTGMINIPTFFRHARKKEDAYFALSIMTIIVCIFQVLTIFMGVSESDQIFLISKKYFYQILAPIFVIFGLYTVNLVNIYYASAGWEMLFPKAKMVKEYVVIGLLGTSAYTFFQILKPLKFLEYLSNNLLSNLGVVLLLSYLVKLFIKHRPRKSEKLMNYFCWLMGCIVSLYLQIYSNKSSNYIILAGMGATFLAFILLIFYEETFFVAKHFFLKKRRKNGTLTKEKNNEQYF